MSHEVAPLTVLLVDDETGILNSLRRLLRKEPWQLLTAENAEQALQLADQHALDMIVSDARMPGMDGAELLAEIQRRQPDCVRVLLTGYADVSTTVRAINEGRIYHYISKPWDDDELLLTLRQGLALRVSERERKRLEKLTRLQNRQLRELNNSLEQKVLARTAELQQTADMLDLAYADLKQSYVVSTQVFAAMMQQRLPREQQTNESVISIARAWAEHSGMDELSKENLLMASALYNIGKVVWDDGLLQKSTDLLYREDRQAYRQYPATGENFLMALDPLRDAARIIRQHMERWDGQGFPDQLSGPGIATEARMLRLVVDYVELQAGMVLKDKASAEQAQAWVKRYSGRLYDPELAKAFLQFIPTMASQEHLPDASEALLDTRSARPGMVLNRDLYSASGLLLLNAGKELTRNLIDRLQIFEATDGVRYEIFVRVAGDDSDAD